MVREALDDFAKCQNAVLESFYFLSQLATSGLNVRCKREIKTQKKTYLTDRLSKSYTLSFVTYAVIKDRYSMSSLRLWLFLSVGYRMLRTDLVLQTIVPNHVGYKDVGLTSPD